MSGIYKDNKLVNYSQYDKPHMSKFLNMIRERNRQKASKCFYCGEPSKDILAIGAYLKFVCTTHFILHGPNTQESFEE